MKRTILALLSVAASACGGVGLCDENGVCEAIDVPCMGWGHVAAIPLDSEPPETAECEVDLDL